jgi:hypothetical protein
LDKLSEGKVSVSVGYDRNDSKQKVDKAKNDYKQTSNAVNLNIDFSNDNFILGLGAYLDLGNLEHNNNTPTKINTNVINLYSKVNILENVYLRAIISGGMNAFTEKGYQSNNSKLFASQLEGVYNYNINQFNISATFGGRFSYVATPEHELYEVKCKAKNYNRNDLVASIALGADLVADNFIVTPQISVTRFQKISKDSTEVELYQIREGKNEKFFHEKKINIQTKEHYTEFSTGLNVKYNMFNLCLNGSYDIGKGYTNMGGSINLRAEF